MKRLLYILLFISSLGFGQQYARPSSTITAQTGTGSYLDVDETTFSDSDYLTSNDNTDTTWEALFSSVNDPNISFGHIIRWRDAQADGNVAPASAGTDPSYSAYLYQGATLIATLVSGQIPVVDTFTAREYALSSTEISNITDYTDLRIRVDITGGGGSPSNRRGVAISWVEFEIINPNPTVALNTADATNFGTDDTPTVEFTGTDPKDSNDLEYRITIYSNEAEVDSYNVSNYSNNVQTWAGYSIEAQSFTGDGTYLKNLVVYLIKGSTGSDILTRAKLYAHSGTFGTSSVGTGSALATSYDVSTADISTSISLVTYHFDGTYLLANGTNYVIGIEAEVFNGNVAFRMGFDATAPTHSGNRSSFDGTTWTSSTQDYVFYVNSATIDIDKDSTTDTGFANTVSGGDAHPFNEDEKISYTVQGGDALADGTYNWHVTAKAPSGTNVYGNVSEVRTFIVNSATPTTRIYIIN